MIHAVLGLSGLLLLAFLFSEDRRRIPWRTVAAGVGLQIGFALLLIGLPTTSRVLFWLNDGADALNRATLSGTRFVFGYLGGGALPFAE
ncbi:MAG TPA: Na+ dependent nucleoside transporter N-terminal domain-containing protein, partial [Rhodopila sp.]|nr:Na+ dependent nucleoside transporter N-terminal domain-containing protein [Rhodopila sp.]